MSNRKNKKAAAFLAACMLTAGTAPQISVQAAEIPAPVFSQESGFYADAFELELSAPENCTICYTLDGSDPTADSPHYEAPITVYDRTPDPNVCSAAASKYNPPKSPVNKAMIVRAAAYDAAGNLSDIVTKSYFIGYAQDNYLFQIPVISLVTDPDNLFNEETGIYVEGKDRLFNYMQKGKEWERPASFTVFENGNAVYSAETGIRIHGNSTSMALQKSFKLYSRGEYGTKKFAYDFFRGAAKNVQGEPISSFDHLILRNGGNDETLKLRDRLNQDLAAGCRFGTQTETECVVFLDGEFWGLYNITEKLNESYLAAHYNVKKKSVCLIKDPLEYLAPDTKGAADFAELVSLACSDLTGADAYDRVAAVMDMNSFAEYMAAEMILANRDINDNNFALWKTDAVDSSNPYADGKWRFLLYDTEYGQGYNDYCLADADLFDWMQETRAWTAQLLRALLASSPKFRGEFAQAYYTLCGQNFSPENALRRLDELRPRYQTPLAETYDRFPQYADDPDAPDAETALDTDFAALRTFWTNRADYAKAQLAQYLQTVSVAGDLNGDRKADAEDAALLCGWLCGKPESVPADCAAGDLNANGMLDAADLTMLKQRLSAQSTP